jgi:hypothetical protein
MSPVVGTGVRGRATAPVGVARPGGSVLRTLPVRVSLFWIGSRPSNGQWRQASTASVIALMVSSAFPVRRLFTKMSVFFFAPAGFPSLMRSVLLCEPARSLLSSCTNVLVVALEKPRLKGHEVTLLVTFPDCQIGLAAISGTRPDGNR